MVQLLLGTLKDLGWQVGKNYSDMGEKEVEKESGEKKKEKHYMNSGQPSSPTSQCFLAHGKRKKKDRAKEESERFASLYKREATLRGEATNLPST